MYLALASKCMASVFDLLAEKNCQWLYKMIIV